MKPRLAVHKFASCDGCQLSLLNAGEDLLRLATQVEIVHFAEAGPVNPDAEVDIALIEGSITTAQDRERIGKIRGHSRYVMTIGACATAGGVQALRNYANVQEWTQAIYAQPQYIATLAESTPIREHIRVDFEVWGCPVNTRQVLNAIRDLLSGVSPRDDTTKVCLECKRRNYTCVMVSHGLPCLGPVTRSGCGALCPSLGRECYGCYGPAENPNTQALTQQFQSLGLDRQQIVNRFRAINCHADVFNDTAESWADN
jgi:sulfhydrogenase subunit delta